MSNFENPCSPLSFLLLLLLYYYLTDAHPMASITIKQTFLFPLPSMIVIPIYLNIVTDQLV